MDKWGQATFFQKINSYITGINGDRLLFFRKSIPILLQEFDLSCVGA
jgi:hypothetical protein